MYACAHGPAYRSKRPKWPVPLTDGVKAPGAAGGGKSKSKPKTDTADAAPASAPADNDAGAGDDEMSPYFHGNIKKGAADGVYYCCADKGGFCGGEHLLCVREQLRDPLLLLLLLLDRFDRRFRLLLGLYNLIPHLYDRSIGILGPPCVGSFRHGEGIL